MTEDHALESYPKTQPSSIGWFDTIWSPWRITLNEEIWEILGKCQLRDAVVEKQKGLDPMDKISRWQPSQIDGVKTVVQEQLSKGVNEHGLTLTAFLFLHALCIEIGCLDNTWAALRKFGYDNDIKLASSLIPVPVKKSPDQSVELTNEAIDLLKWIFDLFDGGADGALRSVEIEDLFSTAPECPWNEDPYRDAAEKTALGGLPLDGFLSQWALMTLLDPAKSLENLVYIGYPGDPSSAVNITKTRRINRKKQQSDRNVFHCWVFGPKKAGKSSLLNSFLGRPFNDTYTPTTEEQYAVNVVEQMEGGKRTQVLREIPEDGVRRMLAHKEALAPCGIAIFVHDCSDESSGKGLLDCLWKWPAMAS